MNGKFLAPVNVMKAQEVLQKHMSFATVIADQESGEIKMSVFDYDNAVESYELKYTSEINTVKELQNLVDIVKGGERVAFIEGVNLKTLENSGLSSYKDQFNELLQPSQIYGIPFNRVVAEFLQSKGQTLDNDEASIEAISNFYSPVSKDSLINDKEVMRMIERIDSTNESELYKNFPYVTEEKLEQTIKDFQARNKNLEARTSTIEKQLAYMGEALQDIGREYELLQSRGNVAANREMRDYYNSLSEEGKQKYRDAGMSDKIQILIKKGSVVPERFRDGTDSYHRLMTAMTNPAEGNYLIVAHVSTTGNKQSDMPIQFYAAAFKRGKDGVIDFESTPETCMYNIKISQRLLADREAQIQQKGFDPFNYAGVDLTKYKNDPEYSIAPEKAILEIHNFFAKHSGTVVTIGERYAQKELMKIGSAASLNSANSVDIISACMYYAYKMECEERASENVIFGENYNGTFSLQQLADENHFPKFKSTADRCAFASQICVSTFVQYIKDNKERFPDAYQKVVKLEAAYGEDAAPEPDKKVEQKGEVVQETTAKKTENTLGGIQFAKESDDDYQPQREQTVTAKQPMTRPQPQTAAATKAAEPVGENKAERPVVTKNAGINDRVPRRSLNDSVQNEQGTAQEPSQTENPYRKSTNAFSGQAQRLPTDRPRQPVDRQSQSGMNRDNANREPMNSPSSRYTSPRDAQNANRPTAPMRDNGNADLIRLITQQNDTIQRMVEEQARQNAQMLTAITSITNSFTAGLQTMQKAIEAQKPSQEIQQAMLETLRAMQESQTVFTETLLDQERTNSRNLGLSNTKG